MASEPVQHLQIRDFSDRELLAVIRDAGGTVVAAELAQRIFVVADGELPHFTRCVTSRLVWMRRYGLIDRTEEGAWAISAEGEELRAGRVSDTVAAGIDRMGETSMLNLGHVVGVKLVAAGPVAGRAMQRELSHQMNKRKARLRGW